MDKAHPLSFPMVIRSLNIKDDPFRPEEENEEILGSEAPYLNAIGALIYLANNTRPDIAFSSGNNAILIGYADAGYLSDPHMAKSQTGYIFTYAGTAISWKSTKQTLTATSSNHVELITLYEAIRECVWLRSMIDKLQEDCGLNDTTRAPTTIYEDNDKDKKIKVQEIQSCENPADLFTK
ncbi:secreted RxLR effector protein 161-like [Amaranthus tricolor]|uniref:secreted RxLR effector protein 161-like n=1 Tax=Amaranthus tricolor TaxID=29722 RepID=UPI0025901D4C|nr:secreted RxLR effector protein 161-like [Amaranthus tricolor]